MKPEIGNPQFPIWLLGDSNPVNWHTQLDTPFDPRHPARHNIWTPILDGIQDHVFREKRLRVETKHLYIRNAVENPAQKPDGNLMQWDRELELDVTRFQRSMSEYAPVIVFTFGSFAYEFARRSRNYESKPFRYWSTKMLGQEFKTAVKNFDVHKANIFPLLHATIARGYFLTSHLHFCNGEDDNYFIYVAENIAQLMLRYHGELSIWID